MSMYSSKFFIQLQRYFAAVAIATMLFAAVPSAAFAQVVPAEDTTTESGTEGTDTNATGGESTSGDGSATDGTDGTDGSGSTTGTDSNGTDNAGIDGTIGTEGETGTDGGVDTTTGSSTDSDADTDTASSTDTGTGTASTTDSGAGDSTDAGGGGTNASSTEDGTDGGAGTGDAADGTTSDPGTGTNGTEGADGTAGADGTSVTDELSEDPDPVTIISDNQVADDATPDDGEEVTGSRTVVGHRSKVTIRTGEATAQAELTTDVNSGDVKSYVEESALFGDFDNYYFNASGSNEANVTNTGAVLALTGDNEATTEGGPAEIISGAAYAALNIANVVNTSVVNSDGFMYLGNRMLEPNQSLDLTDFFFPDPDGELARANDCNLLSCVSEDVYYNFSQMNTATVTNNAEIEAVTGENYVDTRTSFSNVYTGDAYGGANIMNIVNTNIIDSNYRFLTLNAMGDLDGDILLPTQELFNSFYGKPNGMTQLESAEDRHLTIDNTNEAIVDNNLDTEAETGLNTANSSISPIIMTGDASAESNVLSKINQNILGGDVMYLLIRVHGYWDGQVRGLPEGLAWTWTPDGVLIYNEDAEIVDSPLLPYDVDTYNAEITDFNTVAINNNVTIDAITGKNEAYGGVSTVVTGNAVASANVMNVANTNVIAANWTFAVINIFGDFDGDIAFSATDLTLTGELSSADPLAPGDALVYTYTVHNNSTLPATNVVLAQTLSNASTGGGAITQSVEFGDLAPGESATVELTATVDDPLPVGTTSVEAIAVVNSYEAEATPGDNAVLLTRIAEYNEPQDDTDASGNTGGGASGGGSGGSATTTDGGTSDTDTGTTTDDTATTTDDGTTDDADTSDTGDGEVLGENDTTASGGSSSGGGGGGGGGGGSKSSTKSIERSKGNDDPDRPPFLIIKKTSNVDEEDVVKAGQTVDYTLKLTNNGGTAYDAKVYDTLKNPIGAVLNEQSWDLGTILADEVIEIEYSTTYDFKTPSGVYTNTARVEAYRHEDSKENGDRALMLDEAVHQIEISGVALAIGNVGVVAYYPNGTGALNALITWETSKPASGQVMYSRADVPTTYSPLARNFGYENLSFRFNTPKTKHYMILRNITPGTAYNYKIRSTNGDKLALQGDYNFTAPVSVQGIGIVLPNGTIAQLGGGSRVAGAMTSRPIPTTPTPAPAPATLGSTYTAPAKQSLAKTNSDPAPAPEPEPTPTPAVQSNNNSTDGGFFGGVTKKVFGLFR